MKKTIKLRWGMAGLALFLLCAKENTLYMPSGKEPARCFGRLSNRIINNPSIKDTAYCVPCDTIHTGDSIGFIGFVTPGDVQLKSAAWNFGDGTSSTLRVSTHRYSKGGLYKGIFTIEDRVGITMSDTVIVHVNTPPGPVTPLSPFKGQTNVDPNSSRILKWRCNDPDGDDLLYKVYFNTGKNFVGIFAETKDSSVVVEEKDLIKLTTYYWMVTAIDDYGESSISDIFWFRTKDPNATTGSIEGYAFFQGWPPKRGILIRLIDTANLVNPQYAVTNDSGFFSIGDLPPKKYKVIAQDTLKKEFVSDTGYATVSVGAIAVTDTLLLRDIFKPVVSNNSPISIQKTRTPQVSVKFSDRGSGILQSSATLIVDDSNVTAAVSMTDSGMKWTPSTRLPDGIHRVAISVTDAAGNGADTMKWSFVVDAMQLVAMPDTTLSINDTCFFQCRVKNVFSKVKQYKWDYDNDGTWDDSLETSDTILSHPHVYTHEAIYTAIVSCRDDWGMTKIDTVTVTVKKDAPQIVFISGDTVIDHGGAVRCSVYVQQQFGTMTVGIDTANSGNYKNIGNLGLSGDEYYSFSTGNACAWDSVKVRVVDSKGNVAAKGFRVRIRPQPLTITSIDSAVNTITVHYSRTAETDFAEYRIYRNISSSVDTASEWWATIQAEGTVSCTTPSPSYARTPRYYRVYQKDKEGLWSAGSNVVYGNIVNSPPATPIITYPSNNGDSIWSNEVLRWKCSDVNNQVVTYKVLINYNNSGYGQFAAGIPDTFVWLKGYDSLGITFKVIAYDSDGDSSGWSAERTAIIHRNIVLDVEGNVYNVVKIGRQIWMAENLRTAKYNDGAPIPLVKDNSDWVNGSGYCWYNNDSASYAHLYGALYEWHVVNTGKLAPIGWHVPTDLEWSELTTYLGGEISAGGKLKEAGLGHWAAPNLGATNETGFSALPGGSRDYNGAFMNFGGAAQWWSSTASNGTHAISRAIDYTSGTVVSAFDNMGSGYSVRCIRDQ